MNVVLELPQQDPLLPGKRKVLTQAQANGNCHLHSQSSLSASQLQTLIAQLTSVSHTNHSLQLGQRHKGTDKEAAITQLLCGSPIRVHQHEDDYTDRDKAISRRAKDILIHVDELNFLVHGSAFVISCMCVLKSHICVVLLPR